MGAKKSFVVNVAVIRATITRFVQGYNLTLRPGEIYPITQDENGMLILAVMSLQMGVIHVRVNKTDVRIGMDCVVSKFGIHEWLISDLNGQPFCCKDIQLINGYVFYFADKRTAYFQDTLRPATPGEIQNLFTYDNYGDLFLS